MLLLADHTMGGRQHVPPPNQHTATSKNRPSRIRTIDKQRHPRMFVQLEQITAHDTILVLQTAIIRRPSIGGWSLRWLLVIVVVFGSLRNERLTIRSAKRTAYSRGCAIASTAMTTDCLDKTLLLWRLGNVRCSGVEQRKCRTTLLVDTAAGLQLMRNTTQIDGRRDDGRRGGGVDTAGTATTDQWPAEEPEQALPASESTCDP